MEKEYTCPYCNGDGFTEEHDIHPHPDGDCMGMCPIQVQCFNCKATGKVDKKSIEDYEKNGFSIEEYSDLQF